MQVYIVEKGEYSNRGIIGVFSTIQKAQEYIDMEKFIESYDETFSIDSWEVDEHHETECVNLVLINNEIYNFDSIRFQIDYLYDTFDDCVDRVIEVTKDWVVDYFKKDFGYGSENLKFDDEDFKFDDKMIKFPIYIVKGVAYNTNKDVMKKVVYDSIAKYKAEKEGI
jgi:hypothetical protein